MNFQEQGTFQLAFLSTEFYDPVSFAPKSASRKVKLGGRYKLKLKGLQFVSSSAGAGALSSDAVVKPWLFLIQSPQFTSNFTTDTTGFCFSMSGFMLTEPAAQSGKISYQYGDTSCEFLTYFQDRMELFITAGDSYSSDIPGFNFNQSLYTALGAFQGTYIFTFEFERLKNLS